MVKIFNSIKDYAVTEDDISIINALSGKKIIALVNKQDLPTMIDMDELTAALGEVGCKDILRISAAESTGKDELYNMIRDMFFSGDIGYNDQIIITNERHKEALALARESLSRVIESIDAGMGEDFYTIDMMGAYEALGKIIGETLEDDLADKIFREFCMGK